jgi:hypothetical protein
MEVRVSDPAFVYDLVCSLKQAAYVATALDSNTVLVRPPETSTIEQARTHLAFYLVNWRARHPGVDADLVQPL